MPRTFLRVIHPTERDPEDEACDEVRDRSMRRAAYFAIPVLLFVVALLAAAALDAALAISAHLGQ
jgi:hypothetical protein